MSYIIKTSSNRIINNKLRATEWEKIQHAEFGTPFVLRQDMLHLVPKSFWKNPNHKILEPAVGKGGFVVDVIHLLMDGLRDKISSDKRRYRHIVENMVYFADINKSNIRKLKKLLDPAGIYKINGFAGDSISNEVDLCNIFEIEGFNLVLGNPPYNISGKVATGNTIYQIFIKRSLEEWILPRGYLLFVTPPAWRKPATPQSINAGLWELMTQKNWLKFLEIHNAKDGKKIFNAGTRYDFYLIQRVKPKLSIIIDEQGKSHKLSMKHFPWLPNYDYDFIRKLFARKDEPRVDIMFGLGYYSQRDHMSKKKDNKHPFVCIHSTPKKGIRYMYSATDKKGHFGVPKVIFGDSGPYGAFINREGKFCMTEHAMGIVDKKQNLGKILDAMKSEKMREVLGATLWSPFQIDWRMFEYFKKDFYKYFL